MREIRFRAKNIKTQEWIYGYYLYIKEQDKHYILTGKLKTYPVDVVHPYLVTEGFEWIEIDPRTLKQFTGILDKNECEIYEGDLLEGTIVSAWSKTKIVCKVVWCKDSWISVEAPNRYGERSSHKLMFGKDCVVIGNTLDNSELYTYKR